MTPNTSKALLQPERENSSIKQLHSIEEAKGDEETDESKSLKPDSEFQNIFLTKINKSKIKIVEEDKSQQESIQSPELSQIKKDQPEISPDRIYYLNKTYKTVTKKTKIIEENLYSSEAYNFLIELYLDSQMTPNKSNHDIFEEAEVKEDEPEGSDANKEQDPNSRNFLSPQHSRNKSKSSKKNSARSKTNEDHSFYEKPKSNRKTTETNKVVPDGKLIEKIKIKNKILAFEKKTTQTQTENVEITFKQKQDSKMKIDKISHTNNRGQSEQRQNRMNDIKDNTSDLISMKRVKTSDAPFFPKGNLNSATSYKENKDLKDVKYSYLRKKQGNKILLEKRSACSVTRSHKTNPISSNNSDASLKNAQSLALKFNEN